MNVWTKRGVDIVAPTDAAGNPRKVVNGEMQTWMTEVERLFNTGAFNSVDAVGLYADRSTFDGEAEGFVYVSIDGDGAGSSSAVAFIKESAASGDWSPPVPFQGDKGWSPLFRAASDGARRVLEVYDWVGGDGEKPATVGFVGAAGLTPNIAEAIDIRGPQGVSGTGLSWSFDDGTADADPGAGNLRADAADLSAATELFVSKTSAGGDPVASFLAGLTNSTSTHKGYLILTDPSTASQATFDVTGTTDAAGYVKLAVSGHSGALAFADAALLSVVFSRTGNAGDLNGVNPGPAGLAVLEAETTKAVRETIRVAVQPEGFGATYDGSDDAAAIEAAAAVAVAQDRPLLFSPGRTYSFSSITLPEGLVVRARGATLRALGGLPGTGDVEITINNGVSIDELALSHPGGSRSNYYLVEIGDDVRMEECSVMADVQTNASCVHMVGSRTEIGRFTARKVDRPLAIEGVASTTEGSRVWEIDIDSYVRGVKVANHRNYIIGNHLMRGRSPNVPIGSMTPGHNGILVEGGPDGLVLDGVVADAGEHAYRIGGHADIRSERITFGTLTAIRPRGCAFKSNPLGKGNPTEDYATNISIAYLDGVDVGDGQLGELGKQPDFCRVSSTKGFRLGGGGVKADQQAQSCLAAIALNDVDDVVIGPVDAERTAAGLFVIRETQDVLPGNEGSVKNVRVNGLTGSLNHPTANTAITFDTTQEISDIYLSGVEVRGYNTRLLIFNSSANVTGRIAIAGKSYGPVLPLATDSPATPFCTLDWSHNGGLYYNGQLSHWRYATGVFQIAGVDPLNLNDGPAGFWLNSSALTPLLNAYTTPFEFSRSGTTRRGGAIAGKHTSSDLDQMGLAFFVKSNTLGASDALIEGMVLDHNANLAVTGALSKGSGTFKIDHPLDPENKHLIHGFIEGPRYDLIYRGKTTLANGRATVSIDAASSMTEGTFAALTQSAEVVALNNTGSFARVKSTSIVGGQFDIICEDESSSNEVTWVVMAERSDRFIREKDPWTGEGGRLIPEWSKI